MSDDYLVDEEVEDNSPKGLREQLKKETARRKEAESQLVGLTLSELGLDPSQGLGKAVTQLYDGKVETESIKEFVAKEFNYGVQEAEMSEVPVDDKATKSEQVNMSEARVQQLDKVASHVETSTLENQMQEILQNGSVKETIAAKLSVIDAAKEKQ